MNRTLSILLFLVMLLAACQAQNQPPVPLPPAQTDTPFQAVPPTFTPTLTLTPTQTPTLTPEPSPTIPPCLDQQGSLERYEMVFSSGKPPLGFQVYLPPCFGVRQNVRYPVLYMIHGQSFKDDQWPRLGITTAADDLITQQQAPPFIIVMPYERNSYADITTTPFPTDLIDGLIPWVDSQYPTCARRECRAIGGLSRGGAWALHLGFTRWDLFGAIGLHSTPPFIGDPTRFPAWLKAIPPDQIPRIYMDTGKLDYYLKPTVEFEDLLVQLQVPHEWYLFNGTHNEEYWSAHVGDYLQWYTQPWQAMRAELAGQ